MLADKFKPEKFKKLRDGALGRMNPKQRQYLLFGGGLLGFFLVMWLLTAIGNAGKTKPPPPPDPVGISAKTPPSPILVAGQAVRPADVWIANAGKDVDQLKKDREEARAKLALQEKTSKEMLARFEELQKKLTDVQRTAAVPPPPASAPAPETPPAKPVATAANTRTKLPPLPPPPRAGGDANLPMGEPGGMMPTLSPAASLVRASMNEAPAIATPNVAAAAAAMQGKGGAGGAAVPQAAAEKAHTLDTFLPISFTKAVLLGGLDAPTGGQSQANPHPVLLRLEDNAVLPNKFRGSVRECFVVGAGYGDLSSERAYIRTERLSCMRSDGTAIELKIKGSIFGEDGKVGVRGRLVSKQGQVLANALIAGVVSGIGAGVQSAYSTQSTTALGVTNSVDPSNAMQNGLGQGFGKAMDRLATYYIALAEKMFPIVEVDAGRLVDVVLTEGVVLDTPLTTEARAPAARNSSSNYYGSQRPRMQPIGAHDED